MRNLPFTTNEENLRKHFEEYGEVLDVTLLKKPDGKLVGCGFIQFKLVQKAAKARYHANKKPFLGREIECDWALAKDKYHKETLQKQTETVTVKEEEDEAIKKEIKEEPLDLDDYESSNVGNVKVKKENTSDNEENSDKNVVKEDEDRSGNTKNESDEDQSLNGKEEMEDDEEKELENDEDLDEENEDEELESNEDIKDSEFGDANEEKKPHVVSNDVVEGKTVFIRNVPFQATNEDLKECMRQFGPTYYALICVDKFTEHSKGTAFVKFQV